ncbi:MAG: hypothetical protein ABIQ70_13005 [Dokdonella sp.]
MAERRRILLAEITPEIPQASIFSTLNPLDKDASITLSLANLTATASAAAWRCVRNTIPMLAGQWYWESVPTFAGSGDVAFGISTSTASLVLQPGATGTGGLSLAISKSGIFLLNGVNVGSTTAFATGATLRHWLDLDRGVYYVQTNLFTGWSAPIPVPTSTLPLYVIVGLNLSGSACSMRFGGIGLGFTFTPPDGANFGVYSTPAGIPTTLYVGSEGFNTLSSDTPASTHYTGRVSANPDVEVESEGGSWVWGAASISRPGQLVIINNDGALDGWADYEWRDAPVTILRGFEGDARSAFTTWRVGTVEAIEFTNDRRILLNLADPLLLGDRQLQTTTYPRTQANAQIVGNPIGVVIGRPLYCEGNLLDTAPAARDIQVHDDFTDGTHPAYLTSIDQVYDKGDLFSGPNDPYVATHPITLANGGNFTTWAGGPPTLPTNWSRITTFGAANDRFLDGGGGTLRCQSSGQQTTVIFHSASTLAAGQRFTIAFTTTAVTKAGTLIFRLDGATTPIVDVPVSISVTGAVSVVIDCIEIAQLQIVLGSTELDVTIDNLTVDSVQVIDWTYWIDNTHRMGYHLANTPAGKVVCNPVGQKDSGVVIETLQPFVNYILARSAGIPAANYGATTQSSLATLMAAANYRVATYINGPKTSLALLRDLLDGWCGWLIPNRSGSLVVGRVVEPSSASTLTLDSTNITGEVVRSIDLAKGLSIRLGGRRNHSPHVDADIVSSATPALKAELKTELTCVRAGAPLAISGTVLSDAYLHAIAAPVKATLLQDAADIQAEASRVTTLWRKTRWFYQVTVILDAAAADLLEPGQTVRLVWSRYGLSGGKNLLVVGVRSRFFSKRVDLKLWG